MRALKALWQREKHRLRPLLQAIQAWRRTRILFPVHLLPCSSKYIGRPKGAYANGASYAASPNGKANGARHRVLYPEQKQCRQLPFCGARSECLLLNYLGEGAVDCRRINGEIGEA